MENLFTIAENKLRENKNCGVLFGIDSDDYNTEHNVTFGDNTIYEQSGNQINIQNVIYNEINIGYLRERASNNLFEPLTHYFVLLLKDDVILDDRHFIEDEWNELRFAKLDEMIEYYNKYKNIVLIKD